MIYRFSQSDIPDADLFLSIGNDFRTDTERENPGIQVHDPESEDLQTARHLAEEQVNASGAWVDVYHRTDNYDYDTVFDEDPDPTYFPPVSLKAFFKPQPLEITLAKWGSEAPNKTEIVFSHHKLYTLWGERMIRPGDVIKVPYNDATLKPKHYRVKNATPSGNFRYHWLYFTCAIETLTADITVAVPGVTIKEDDHLNAGGAYRESL